MRGGCLVAKALSSVGRSFTTAPLGHLKLTAALAGEMASSGFTGRRWLDRPWQVDLLASVKMLLIYEMQ